MLAVDCLGRRRGVDEIPQGRHLYKGLGFRVQGSGPRV